MKKTFKKFITIVLLGVLFTSPVLASPVKKVNKKIGSSPTVNSYYVTNPVVSNFQGDVLPAVNNLYNLGSSTKQWANIYAGGLTLVNGSSRSIYIDSVSGSDSNLGTQASPIKTFAALSALLPAVAGGSVDVHLVTSSVPVTFTVNNFIVPSFVSPTGTSDNTVVLRFIGDTATPSNITLAASDTSTPIMTSNLPNVLLDLNGFTFRTSSIPLNLNNGYAIIRNVDYIGYNSVANSFINSSRATFSASNYSPTFSAQASTTSGGAIAASRFSIVVWNNATTTVNNVRTSAFNLTGNSLFTENSQVANQNITINGGASGCAAGFNTFSSGLSGNLFFNGTVTINNCTASSGATVANGIKAGAYSFVNTVSGFHLITNTTTNPIYMGYGSSWQDGSGNTGVFTFNTSTSFLTEEPGVNVFGTLRNVTTTYTKNAFGGVTTTYSNDSFYGQLAVTNTWSGFNSFTGIADATYFQQGTSPISDSQITTSTLGVGVCNSNYIQETPIAGTLNVVFPSTSTLFGTCLGSVGKFKDYVFQTFNTSSLIIPGAGGTLLTSASTTVSANKAATIRILRDTLTTYLMLLTNYN